MMMTSWSGARGTTAACMSAALCTRTTSAPGRRGTVDGGDQRDLGAAGQRLARRGHSPACPTSGCVMTRTGSIASRVPPAVTSTRTPARSLGAEHPLDGARRSCRGRRGGRRRRRRRPGVRSRAARCHATLGEQRRGCPAPRGAPTSRCAWPGRSTTGARVASRVAVSRSSLMPAA